MQEAVVKQQTVVELNQVLFLSIILRHLNSSGVSSISATLSEGIIVFPISKHLLYS